MISVASAKAVKNFDLSMSAKEIESYSIAKAILASLDSKDKGKTFEGEVSSTLAEMIGRPHRASNAIFIPNRFNPRASGLDSKTGAAGKYTIGVDVPDLFDAFRAQSRLVQLGATTIGGLRFTAQFATEQSATQAYWVNENVGSDVTEVNPVYGAVTGTPKTLQSTCSISHQLLQQTDSNIGLERRLRLDLMRSHAVAADKAGICGSGQSGEPLGLLNCGIDVTSLGVNGAVPTYSLVCDMESTIATNNAPDTIGWLTTPAVRKKLRGTFVNGTGSDPVWGDNGILGRPSEVSTSVPSTLSKGTSSGTLSALICGAFSELYILEWGVTELISDRYRLKKQAMIEVTAFSMMDIIIPRRSAFNVSLDVALS